MGIAFTGSSGNRRSGRRRRSSYQPMSEINVTPFVDVMLVLLIVFMVAAPLLTVGVPIELPEADAGKERARRYLRRLPVQPDGKIYLQESEIELGALAPKLVAIAKNVY